MRRLPLGLIAVGLLMTSAPLAAQRWQPSAAITAQIRHDASQLERHIARAEQRGAISGREAARLRGELDEFRRLYARFGRDGLTRREVARLEREANQVRAALHLAIRDWDGHR